MSFYKKKNAIVLSNKKSDKFKTNDKEPEPQFHKLQLTENYINFTFEMLARFESRTENNLRLHLANANAKFSIIINNQ